MHYCTTILDCLYCISVHFQELHAHINGSISEETAKKLITLKQSKDKSWHPRSQLQLGKHLTLAE